MYVCTPLRVPRCCGQLHAASLHMSELWQRACSFSLDAEVASLANLTNPCSCGHMASVAAVTGGRIAPVFNSAKVLGWV